MNKFYSFLILLVSFGLSTFQTINAQDYASFTAPFGAEYYQSGTEKTITWTSSESGLAKIEYSVDGGSNWILIASSVEVSTEYHNWTVPQVSSNSSMLKITSEANEEEFSTSYGFSIGDQTVLPRILVDETFDDWNHLADLSIITPGESSLYELKVHNDENYLLVFFETDVIYSLQNDARYTVFLDTDNDVNTGLQINGIGAEIEFSFGTRAGKAYLNNNEFDIGAGDLNLVSAPTVWSDKFELTFDRNATIGGNTVFTSDNIKILFENDDAGFFLPDELGGAGYKFQDYEFESLPEYSFSKTNDNYLRIVSHNVEFDGLFEVDRIASYNRIYAAIKPNIITFQEIYDHSNSQIADRFEGILPSSQGEQWNVDQVADCGVATRYTIKETYSIGGFGNGGFVLDLRPAYDTDILVISAHPPCCNNDTRRQQESDAMMAFIKDAKTEGGQLTIAENTPIIITGDMNFVGDPQQITTLVTGDIADESTYGSDFNPDWDNTDLTDAKPYVNSSPKVFTQGNPQAPGNYSQGRLDFIIYSGSVIDLKNSYVLYSESLPQDSLSTYGLQSGDCTTASDHYPVVADFSLEVEVDENTILALRENDSDGVPVHFGSLKTVTGVVTVSDEFGTSGPAFIQDETAGVAIFSEELISQFTTGERITITSDVGFFNGQTQLIYNSENSEVIVNGSTNLPNSKTVTIEDILNQNWNEFELLEGSFVKVNNIEFTATGNFEANTNYEVSDGVNSLIIRIDGDTDLVGVEIPAGKLTIKGLVSQFDNTSPYSEGYQLNPRNQTDITSYVPTDIDIIELRNNNLVGISIYDSQFKTITGIVTISDEFGNNGPAFIQDEEAGIAIFGSELISQFSSGDSVTISGDISNFNGQTQMIYNAGLTEVVVHKRTAIPAPEVVTVTQIVNQEWDGAELLEGKLLKLESISFTSGGLFESNTTYQISDGENTITVRIDENTNLVGQVIPITECTVIGSLSQFDPNLPYDEGYQLNLRSTSDIITVAPAFSPSPVNNKNVVPINTTISWSLPDDIETIDLFFGTNIPPTSKVLDNVAAVTSYDPGILEYGTTYYWKLNTINKNGYAVSSIWSFETISTLTSLDNSSIKSGFKIIPNPSTGIFKLEVGNQFLQTVNISILDLAGKVVFEKSISDLDQTEVDISFLRNGLYFIQLQNKEGISIQKLMIEK